MDSTASGTGVPRLELWYGTIPIGHVTRAFFSDDTWFGDFEPERADSAGDDSTRRRLSDYIRLCEDWNDRCHRDPDNPPDADEFDVFSDIIHSQKWFARTPGGDLLPVFRAPVFGPEGDVSWRPA
jgi:hypothetical protein